MNDVWIINGSCEDCVHNERLEAHDPCCDCWCHDDGDDGADDGADDQAVPLPPGAARNAIQRIAFDGYAWSCAWCAAELNDATIWHRADCRWIAEVRAQGAATERERWAERMNLIHARVTVDGGPYCNDDGQTWPCITARHVAGLLDGGEPGGQQ